MSNAADKSTATQIVRSRGFINSGYRIHVIFSLLFNLMIVHGYTPTVLLKSTIVFNNNIPIDYKTLLSSSDTYRGILCLIVFVNWLISVIFI